MERSAEPVSDSQVSGCLFCDFGGKRPMPNLLYEDDRVFAVLDEDWVVKGHTLVVWKQHKLNVSDLTADEYLHFSAVFHRVECAVMAAVDADRALVLKSGGLLPHLHFHSYPVSTPVTMDLLVDLIGKRARHEPEPGEFDQLVSAIRRQLH